MFLDDRGVLKTVMILEGHRFCSFFFHSSSCFVILITRKVLQIVGFWTTLAAYKAQIEKI